MARSDKILLSVIVVLLCASCWMNIFGGYAGDKIWLLYAAREWVNGQKMYVDIFEVNPPLILWLYSIPVWLSIHLHFLKAYEILGLGGIACSALSAWLSLRLIRLQPEFAGNQRKQTEFLLLLLCVFVFFTRPVYFFDREHIFFVLTFPYLLRFMPTLARQPISFEMRIVIGLLAAVGFCIKPYTVIVFAAAQLLVMRRERSLFILWCVENVVIYVLALVYFFCVWRFTPEYIHTILPMALATYSAFSRRIIGLFYSILAFSTAGMIFADFRSRYATPYRRDVYYFAGLGIAFYAYALANNGWGYTFHPLLSQLLFLAGWMAWEYGWLEREHVGRPVKQFLFGQRACTIVLLCNAIFLSYCIAAYFVTPACDWSPDCKKTLPFASYMRSHNAKSFGAFSEDFHRWPWLARLTGAHFDTRYNALWMVPKLVIEGKDFTDRHQWIMDSVGRGLADDLDRKQPDVVFVDNSKEFFGTDKYVDLIAFFSAVPEFKSAWSHYRYDTTFDSCKDSGRDMTHTGCRYDIYGRIH